MFDKLMDNFLPLMFGSVGGFIFAFVILAMTLNWGDSLQRRLESRWVQSYCLNTFADIDRCRKFEFDYYHRWRK